MNESLLPYLTRREAFLAAGLLTLTNDVWGDKKRAPRIVIRSSWQTVNIGDIAHTPGLLRLLEEYIPEAEVRLWPNALGPEVKAIIEARFPNVRILHGEADIKAAMKESDFLLHGSGPFLVGEREVARWGRETKKPYGVYGITFSERNYSRNVIAPASLNATIEALSNARFVYFRDSISLKLAKEKGCHAPIMEFGPDAAFATDLKDDDRANAFLKANGLSPGKFLCCIPRYRYTPYWTIPSKKAPFDAWKHEQNEQHKEADHAPLRDAIVEVIHQSDMKVLLCPEDQTQMAIAKEMILDKLPENTRSRVVWRPDYWLTGEARSTYLLSAGLFGHEMHSPIMCIGAGIPAIVCRWKEQTSKGYMWNDIGLNDWLFDMDKPEDVSRIVPTVLSLAKDPEAAKQKATKAKEFVERRQRETMVVLRKQFDA